MSFSSARARSLTAVVSCRRVPGGSSRLRLLRPRSEKGMKVAGISGTMASEAKNRPVAIHSVRARWRSAASTQPRYQVINLVSRCVSGCAFST